jgi:hypothetical protein
MANPFSVIIPSSVPITPNATSPFVVLGGRTGTQQTDAAIAPVDVSNNNAPPKASAAPKPSITTVGTGLVAELTRYQQSLLNNKDPKTGQLRPLIEVADQYEIIFADNIIADASIVPPAGLDKALAVGSVSGTAADQKLPNKQSMDPTSRARAASAGQQIVQFIDQVIRSSTYIQEQSGQVWDQSSGTWSERKTRANQFAWFQIVCNVEQLPQYDNLRNDFAYKMTFTIVPFETPMLSSYFPSGRYRGVHKDYQYWFTGQNNSVLSFEQSYNAQWVQAITGKLPPDTRVLKYNDQINTNYAQRWKTNVFPASSQSNQGGEKNTNEPGANAADFLYTADLSTAKIVIVGDPAWLPSPASQIVTKTSFTTDPFLADGTVNSIASGAYFRIAFNTPADYNLQTGLMDPSDQSTTTVNGQGVNTVETVYKLQHSTSTFKGGKFTQELTGSWVTYDATQEQVSREAAKKKTDTRFGSFDPGSGPKTGNNAWGGQIGQAQTSLAKGVNQILNPPTVPATALDYQLRGTPAYIEARKAGKNDAQALEIARAASAAGTNNFQNTSSGGVLGSKIRTGPNQPLVKDGNPG